MTAQLLNNFHGFLQGGGYSQCVRECHLLLQLFTIYDEGVFGHQEGAVDRAVPINGASSNVATTQATSSDQCSRGVEQAFAA